MGSGPSRRIAGARGPRLETSVRQQAIPLREFGRIALIGVIVLIGAAQRIEAAPFKKLGNGDVRHVASGVMFPPRIGLFQFAGTQVYDRSGRDVSGRYVLDHLILADVYS